jgi:hypothetical protein
MQAVDASGDNLGEVTYVKMGDPDAVTTVGEEADTGGGLFGGGGFLGGDDEPQAEATIRRQLVRVGFLKVGGGGLFGKGRYASADQVASVSGDTVTLSVMKDDLVRES